MDSLNKTEERFLKSLLESEMSRVNGYLKNCRASPSNSEYHSRHVAKLEKQIVMLNKLMDKLEV